MHFLVIKYFSLILPLFFFDKTFFLFFFFFFYKQNTKENVGHCCLFFIVLFDIIYLISDIWCHFSDICGLISKNRKNLISDFWYPAIYCQVVSILIKNTTSIKNIYSKTKNSQKYEHILELMMHYSWLI